VRREKFFFTEMVRCPVLTCRDSISLILGTRFEILGTRIGSLKHLKKPLALVSMTNAEGSATEKV